MDFAEAKCSFGVGILLTQVKKGKKLLPLGYETLKNCHHSQPPSTSCNYYRLQSATGGHLALGYLVQAQPKETALR